MHELVQTNPFIHTAFMSRITLEPEPLLLLWIQVRTVFAKPLYCRYMMLSRAMICKRLKRIVDGTSSFYSGCLLNKRTVMIKTARLVVLDTVLMTVITATEPMSSSFAKPHVHTTGYAL